MYQKIIAGTFLLIGTYTDLKEYAVYRSSVILAIAGSIFGHLMQKTLQPETWWIHVLPGVISLMLSFLSGDQFGYGDSLAILVLGICLGGEAALELCFLSFAMVFLCAAGMCIIKKAGAKTRIPFLPFLFLSFLLFLFGEKK